MRWHPATRRPPTGTRPRPTSAPTAAPAAGATTRSAVPARARARSRKPSAAAEPDASVGGADDERDAPGAREPDPRQPVSHDHVSDEARAGDHGRQLGGVRQRPPELVDLVDGALELLNAARMREARTQPTT